MKFCNTCFSEKSEDQFYSRDNTCKICRRKKVKENYQKNREQYSAYERLRNQRPERRAKRIEYQKNRRARNPEKEDARRAIMWAVRRGWIKPSPCEVCGTRENLQAHHDDYSKPLEVRWLCFKHHREIAHGQVVVI